MAPEVWLCPAPLGNRSDLKTVINVISNLVVWHITAEVYPHEDEETRRGITLYSPLALFWSKGSFTFTMYFWYEGRESPRLQRICNTGKIIACNTGKIITCNTGKIITCNTGKIIECNTGKIIECNTGKIIVCNCNNGKIIACNCNTGKIIACYCNTDKLITCNTR